MKQPTFGFTPRNGDVIQVTVERDGGLKISNFPLQEIDQYPPDLYRERVYSAGDHFFMYTGGRIKDLEKDPEGFPTRNFTFVDPANVKVIMNVGDVDSLSGGTYWDILRHLGKSIAHIRDASMLGLDIQYQKSKLGIKQALPNSEYFTAARFDIVTEGNPGLIEVGLEGITLDKMVRLVGETLDRKLSEHQYGDIITQSGTRLLEQGVYVVVPGEIAKGRFVSGRSSTYLHEEFEGSVIVRPIIPRYGVEQLPLQFKTVTGAHRQIDLIVSALAGR